jgi:hypothetical protein
MKAFFITAVVVLFSICGNSQTLRKELLTKNDKKNGIFLKFNYSSSNVYGSISLILKADGTFSYDINTCITHEISEGRWKMIKDLLILESTFQMDNIPVEISNEKNRQFVDSFDIAVVENTRHELLTDVFVLINNDTTKCLPIIGSYNGLFEKISRVKILFENGMSSKWMTVNGERKVALTVLTDASIRNYVVMNRRRFKLEGKYLKTLDNK